MKKNLYNRGFFYALCLKMIKFAVGVEYNGQAFHGWQTQQAGVRTVQSCLEHALSKVANHSIQIFCAGRTDAGVHAVGQVIHFKTSANRTIRNWLLGVHTYLPDDISITWIKAVDDDFHARFSAMARSYRYFILNRPTRSALFAKRATWIHQPLDQQKMFDAAQYLVGTHDFSSYRAVACQAKSPIKTVEYINIKQKGELLTLTIKANAFLHHMVRNIAGVLIAIGANEKPIHWSKTVLDYKDRRQGGVTAKADGLYFQQVDYPQKYQLPHTQIIELG